MTTCPQTLCAQRSTLAGTPTTSVDELVRLTLEACEQVHDACLHAVQEALRAKREAPPLNDWLAGASLSRTLAEVLAVEAPQGEEPFASEDARARRPRLSPWATGMAQLCADLCRDLATRQAGEAQHDDEASRTLRQACEDCMHACMRLLAEVGPPGGRWSDAALAAGVSPVPALMRQLRPGSLPPHPPALAAAA